LPMPSDGMVPALQEALQSLAHGGLEAPAALPTAGRLQDRDGPLCPRCPLCARGEEGEGEAAQRVHQATVKGAHPRVRKADVAILAVGKVVGAQVGPGQEDDVVKGIHFGVLQAQGLVEARGHQALEEGRRQGRGVVEGKGDALPPKAVKQGLQEVEGGGGRSLGSVWCARGGG
jgi:hypothetical protein